jgi:hypothetical protein
VVLAAVLFGAVALAASMLLLATPLGHLLPTGGFHFFPSILWLVYPKPTEQMRYLLAIAFVFGLGFVFARVRAPHTLTTTRVGRVGTRTASVGGLLAIVGVATWGWWAQFRQGAEGPTTHFGNGNLAIAVIIAVLLAILAWRRPDWLDPRPFVARNPRSWGWFAIAAVLTVCWLLPSVFREQNLAPASLSVTYHLQFTFDDFAAVVNGRTPLVNYAEQYASLLPFLVWPVFRLGGTEVGTFTMVMCLFSLVTLLAVERALALIVRNERLALALYLPFLATSLFFVIRTGGQLFNWASYYAVFPMRYFGPYVLFWLCMRYLRGLRPRSATIVFAAAGLVALNNIEFGLPALLATFVALMIVRPGSAHAMRLVKDAVIGLVGAFAAVSALTLSLTGQFPSLSLLTLYSRIFGEGGFGLLHTPLGGLYLVVDMVLAAAVLTAALRFREGAADSAYTAALAYCGVFGLGAGNYYMGRTHPAGLVVLFSIWALTASLLALLALRGLARRPARPSAPLTLLFAGALICLGLTCTAVAQFPVPWTQLRRITASAPPPPPYDVSAAVAFVRRTAAPGEPVVLLTPLGHVIALDAGVENVSPYSNQEGVVTYQQIAETLNALRNVRGRRFYAAPTFPEITRILSSEGFRSTTDPTSRITEWRR